MSDLSELRRGRVLLAELAGEFLVQRERLRVSDWADRYRIVPSKSSPEGGRWRTDRTPYAREVLDALSPESDVQEVVIMAAAQVLKTEVVLNWAFSVIDQDPASMLIVQPTEKAVKDFVSQRLDPAIEAMPRIREKVPPARRRDSGNRITEKNYPGGVLYLGWANSPSELASKPIKYLAMDEVDRYPISLKDEGSPVKLAEQRTANFPRRKIVKTSTPKIRGASVITDEYESSSMAQYWVPCPHCGEHQVLEFPHLRWEKDKDQDGRTIHKTWTAHYVCQANGCIIEETAKPQMLAGGEWRHRHPERKKKGYHINGLYSPVGLGFSWGERALKFVEAKGDPAKLQTFVNLHLGEPYEDHSDAIKADQLQARADGYALRTVPPGYMILTLGVDVQRAGWFAFHLVGWGRGERCATIDYVEIPGDPSRSSEWERVITAYRRRPVRNAFGVDLKISMTAIDSGDGVTVHEAYKYARMHQHDGVIAVKGESIRNRPVLGRPSRQDVKNASGTIDRNGVNKWPVGTDTAKSVLFARLDGDTIHPEAENRLVRYSSELPLTFFQGIASEVFDAESGKWIKRAGARNEPLDTWVYAYAAAHHPSIAIHTARASDWDRLEQLMEPRVGDLFAAPLDINEPPAAEPAAQETMPTPAPAAPAQNNDWVPEVPDNWI